MCGRVHGHVRKLFTCQWMQPYVFNYVIIVNELQVNIITLLLNIMYYLILLC